MIGQLVRSANVTDTLVYDMMAAHKLKSSTIIAWLDTEEFFFYF